MVLFDFSKLTQFRPPFSPFLSVALELEQDSNIVGIWNWQWKPYFWRAGLFYPGDGVVDSLLAPRGSTTKRLKESDLVVTQPLKIISLYAYTSFFLSHSINSADAISASLLSLSFRGTRVGTGFQYCGYLELALEAIFLGVFESDSYSARAGLFYPGDGVVDSLLAPRGSTTKRLKESDLVVTQPVKIISDWKKDGDGGEVLVKIFYLTLNNGDCCNLSMVIIRDIVSDFSDEEDIELYCDDDDDVDIASAELVSITFATPSSFFVTIDSQAGQDYQNISNNLNNNFDDDLFIGMHFESKEATKKDLETLIFIFFLPLSLPTVAPPKWTIFTSTKPQNSSKPSSCFMVTHLEKLGGEKATMEVGGDEGRCGSFAEQRSLRKVREKTIVVLEYFIRVIISDFPQESEHING
ncbi:hypothetical protein Lal_00024400 [Lupinus albus]|nr:hypothetical protein Lal_00024400 [Lupinus albus]